MDCDQGSRRSQVYPGAVTTPCASGLAANLALGESLIERKGEEDYTFLQRISKCCVSKAGNPYDRLLAGQMAQTSVASSIGAYPHGSLAGGVAVRSAFSMESRYSICGTRLLRGPVGSGRSPLCDPHRSCRLDRHPL